MNEPEQKRQWEYLYFFTENRMPHQIDKVGLEGWEMITVTEGQEGRGFYFKRPK